MVFRLTTILIVFVLASCGGGGGSSSGPKSDAGNKDNPDPTVKNKPPQIEQGLFTDAPVTGLRYVQGSIEGYTDSGAFSYDANSSEPVCFFIGQVRLGCSTGQGIVTPFNLSAPGQPASLQSGYNISRLLNSMDESVGANIDLPESSKSAKGSVDFGLSDGQFATDDTVLELIERYSPNNTLPSRDDVDVHIDGNSDVKVAIDNLYQDISASISAIKITWNNTLAQSGLLAHVEFQAGTNASHSEHVYLELGMDDTTVFLKRITYINQSGAYVQLNLDKYGHPELANRNGNTYRYLNHIETKIVDWINTSTYSPRQTGYLVGNGGFSDREETVYVSDQFAQDLVAIFNNFDANAVDQSQILQLVRQAMTLVQNVQCAGKTGASCSNKGLDALVLAQSDTGYAAQTVAVTNDVLSPDICLIDVNIPGGKSCNPMPSLAEFNVVIQQGYDAYRGMIVPVWYPNIYAPDYQIEEDVTFYVSMLSWVDEFHDRRAVFGCEVRNNLFRLPDNTYYLTGPAGVKSLSCGAPQLYDCSQHGAEFKIPADCKKIDISPAAGWPGFDSDYQLTMDVVRRLFRKGFGFLIVPAAYYQDPLNKWMWDTERLKYYSDPNFSLARDLERDVSNEDFYYAGVATEVSWHAKERPIQAEMWDSSAHEGYNGASWGYASSGIYRNRQGNEVAIRMYYHTGTCVGEESSCYHPE